MFIKIVIYKCPIQLFIRKIGLFNKYMKLLNVGDFLKRVTLGSAIRVLSFPFILNFPIIS